MRRLPTKPTRRRGSTLVEFALVLPVFLTFVFSLVEFGHYFMVRNALVTIAQKAARIGASDGATTEDVRAAAEEALEAVVGVENATVLIKDASVFDQPGIDPENIDYSGLPDINLANTEPTNMFVVRIEVDYDEVAVLPPKLVGNMSLVGQTAMRRE